MPTPTSDGDPGPAPSIDSLHTDRAFDRSDADVPRAGGGAPRTIIAVQDPRAAHAGTLDDVLARCHLTPRRVPDASTIVPRRPGACGLALVDVIAEPTSCSRALDDVASLKKNGFTVLCVGNGAGEWPLGAQCRLLLAGASHVFDSADAAFTADFREQVEDLLRAETERLREDRRIKLQMLGLGVVGSSPGITSVFRWIVGVSAVSDLPVLIVGETGTGKELAARAIHRLDPRRRNGPFVPVNCAAIAAGLAESELFGHRQGAFTGAERDRKGLVRAARGGVLFLDEVGDLDASLQGKLLRVLQERRVLALGDDQEVPVDVRIIAATNRNLEAMVRRHEFRADLFHRLNVLSIRIPALRERPDDIEPLVQHFLGRCAEQADHGAVSASREFVQALRRVELPGNVRQLENVIRGALVNAKRGDQLRLNNLPPELWLELAREHTAATADSTKARGDSPDGEALPLHVPGAADQSEGHAAALNAVAVLESSSWKLQRALDLCEQKFVAAALGMSRGNRSRAARLLGISPRSIFNKMRKYRLTA